MVIESNPKLYVCVSTYCVPYLKFHMLIFNLHGAGTEFHSDCEIMRGFKTLIGELQQQAGFPYT